MIRLLIAIMNQVDYASEEAFASANRQSTAAMERQNMDSATRLQAILVDSPVGAALPAIALLHLPNWWLAGGAVRNKVWRSLFGNDCYMRFHKGCKKTLRFSRLAYQNSVNILMQCRASCIRLKKEQCSFLQC